MMTLPEGWEMKPLGEVATLQRGFDLPVHKRTPGPFPVFAANGTVGTHDTPKVKGPGVVTGRSGTLGQVHYVENDYWPLNTALWVKDFHGNKPKWIARLLKWMRLETHTRGTGVPTLNRNLVHVVSIPVPPLPEQRHIAAILDKADTVRRKRQEAIKLTEEFLRSVFLDMFGDPVTNPKGWEVLRLSDLCTKITDGEHLNPKFVPAGVPMVMAGDVQNVGVNFDNVKYLSEEDHRRFSKKCSPEFEDILIVSRGATIGRCTLVDTKRSFSLMGSVILLKLNREMILPAYLASLFIHPAYQGKLYKTSGASAQQAIYLTHLKTMELPVPSLEYQKRFQEMRYAVVSARKDATETMNMTETLMASLVQNAFLGKL